MKTLFYIFISILMISFSGCGQKKTQKQDTEEMSADENATIEMKVVRVSNAKEFVNALASHTEIIIAEGSHIDLTQYIEAVVDGSEQLNYREQESSYFEIEEIGDGHQLVIYDMENLIIRGEGKTPIPVQVAPMYSFVFSFKRGTNIHIENLDAGHTEGGYCDGGVFQFVNCSNVTIHKTIMYGSGTEGIQAIDSYDLKCTESVIKECTYSIMTLDNIFNAVFEDCKFHNNKEFTLVNVRNSNNVQFNRCHFYDNEGTLFDLGNQITLKDCQIDHPKSKLGDMGSCIVE